MLTKEALFGKYFKHTDATNAIKENADAFIAKVNALIEVMQEDKVVFATNPLTGTIVGGETLGGFRPQDCPIGASKSAHKQGLAVDLYDPEGKIDLWLQSHASTLRAYGLYFEHPKATPRWSHWTSRAPKSGRLFFYP
jgi:hypothetical protein